ncbi:lipoyl(octanoyl) transferase LipB [Mesobaculum littorinae]
MSRLLDDARRDVKGESRGICHPGAVTPDDVTPTPPNAPPNTLPARPLAPSRAGWSDAPAGFVATTRERRAGRKKGQGMVEWRISDGLTEYDTALSEMEARAAAIAEGTADELIWLLEHPPLYTAGTSARREDLTDPDRFPVFEARRGGQYTYHGPGQRVAYVMLDLNRRGRDLRRFVAAMEAWVIAALAEFNVDGQIREGRVGVWVDRPEKPALPDGTPREDKIAAIGVRVRRWVTFHGLSVNVEPDLSHFEGIVPCGIRGHGVTSLVDLGLPVTMEDLDAALRRQFDGAFARI